MFFSKKLKILDVEVQELEDEKIYRCLLKDKKRNIIDKEPIEISGKELKYLAEMQGQRYGMIRYNNEHFYEVIGEKEKAPN
ncbi:hypothetical protein [Schnuerera sp.]|uniref:hypothetical protein n=1 Tax=Schnuerera sp. TaxID=2794844 RepID=UPI002C9AF2C8|nr:hypothetical protein [Schnuerera sp.]HSH35662.1 hypothetical protein [Schnuerera sp.]